MVEHYTTELSSLAEAIASACGPVFGAAVLGAGLGFLWFNAHPAQVFMGDVGALALGGALGTQAFADAVCSRLRATQA